MMINCKSCMAPVDVPERPVLSTMVEVQCQRCGAVNYAIVSYPSGSAMPTGQPAFPWLRLTHRR
jgi:uncharacterized Zn finger protein